MSAFSPEQRTNLDDYGRYLSTEIGRSCVSRSALTERSRQNHFLGWEYDTIGLEDPCLKGGHPQGQNYLLACYLVSLVKGESIKGKMLRKKTIDRYLSAALAIFDKRGIKKNARPPR